MERRIYEAPLAEVLELKLENAIMQYSGEDMIPLQMGEDLI